MKDRYWLDHAGTKDLRIGTIYGFHQFPSGNIEQVPTSDLQRLMTTPGQCGKEMYGDLINAHPLWKDLWLGVCRRKTLKGIDFWGEAPYAVRYEAV